jgi:integrase/recombinase XerD|tara:strand:- start:60 stop:659 length:600 start_codon:yes stop_codon:yes gene_type:complete
MKKENGKAKVLNKTEFNRVVKFQISTRHGLRNVLLLHLSFFLGLRSKEMASLIIGDLMDVNGDLKEEVTLKRHQTKRGKQRRFYITNDKLKKVILQYLNTRKGVDGNWDLNAPLIKNQMPSGKFSSASLQQCFKKMYESVGIDASSHSGRRSFCTNLSENGISITNLQTLMGHQSISTTALYINENPKILGKISEGFSL